MAPQELVDYIGGQLKTGLGFGDIKKSLFETGWDEKSIDEAYREVVGAPPPPSASQENGYVSKEFSSHPSLERALKRLVIFSVGVGLVVLFLYIFMR